MLNSSQASGQYYNFSNVRYGAPPVGKLRFSAPVSPAVIADNASKPLNDGSKGVSCHQVSPAWFVYSNDWLVNGTAAFNISAGYQVPPFPASPPVDPTATEDCLFLDIMTPKAVFDAAGQGKGAPV
jgi:cholinesterase